MINFLCGETLLKLSLSISIPETIKAVKESCPNIIFLHVKIDSTVHLDQMIRPICELSALKILDIETRYYDEVHKGLLMKILGDQLTSVECLSFSFGYYYGDLLSFKYFTDNCKANLKKWRIGFYSKDLLLYVNNYQKVHNSLKVLGIDYTMSDLANEELEIVDSLKNQGVDIVPSNELFFYSH
jgi:hypothetical protein